MLRRAGSEILEVGVGTGNSLKDYPPGRRIMAVDISWEMLSRARAKITDYQGSVDLHHEDVQRLSFEDEAFDTVFTSCVFCSVADPIKGLVELRRVLRKDGQAFDG